MLLVLKGYNIIVLMFLVWTATVYGAPISITSSGSIPAHPFVGKHYTIQYALVNELPSTFPTALHIIKRLSGQGFSIDDQCNGKILPSQGSCLIDLNYLAQQSDSASADMTLSYHVYTIPFAHVEVEGAIEVAVNGSITMGLPGNTGLDNIYPYQVSFQNGSDRTITGVSLTKNYPSDFHETADTCFDSIGARQSCYIAGQFIPTQLGMRSFKTTLHYDQGPDISKKSDTVVEQVAVEGQKTTVLPDNTAIGHQYPVQFTFTNINRSVPANNLTVTKQFPQGFTQTADTCSTSQSLAGGASCYISGVFAPKQTGDDRTVSVTLSYTGGQPVMVSTQTSVREVPVSSVFTQSLPNNITLNRTYPVTLKFENKSSLLPATGINITQNFPTAFALSSNTCGQSLAPLSSCMISGELTPTAFGPVSVGATLSYAEGQDVTDHTDALVKKVAVVSSIPTPLPPNLDIDMTYPVKLVFTNTSPSVEVRHVRLIPQYSQGFTVTADTCSRAGNLAAQHACYIEGQLKATALGPASIGATLTYDEGDDVQAFTRGMVEDVVVNGRITQALPDNMAMGRTYPVAFSFLVGDSKAPATGITLTTNFPNVFKVSQNTCQGIDTLAPTHSCVIEGEYTPTSQGNVTIGATLDYKQGQAVSLFTSGAAEPVVVRGKLTRSLPVSTAHNATIPVTFSFTNTSDQHDATAVAVVLSNPDNDFIVSKNTCNGGSLAPGATCDVSGDFIAKHYGAKTIGVTLQYREGRDVGLTSKTEVVDAKDYTVTLQSGAHRAFYSENLLAYLADKTGRNFYYAQPPAVIDNKPFMYHPSWNVGGTSQITLPMQRQEDGKTYNVILGARQYHYRYYKLWSAASYSSNPPLSLELHYEDNPNLVSGTYTGNLTLYMLSWSRYWYASTWYDRILNFNLTYIK